MIIQADPFTGDVTCYFLVADKMYFYLMQYTHRILSVHYEEYQFHLSFPELEINYNEKLELYKPSLHHHVVPFSYSRSRLHNCSKIHQPIGQLAYFVSTNQSLVM